MSSEAMRSFEWGIDGSRKTSLRLLLLLSVYLGKAGGLFDDIISWNISHYYKIRNVPGKVLMLDFPGTWHRELDLAGKTWFPHSVGTDQLDLEDTKMELTTLLTSNTLVQMEMMSLMMYQEQLLMLPYYYHLIQQQETFRPAVSPEQPDSRSQDESPSQLEPLDLRLSKQQRTNSQTENKTTRPHCVCPLCRKEFSRPWLLKGKGQHQL